MLWRTAERELVTALWVQLPIQNLSIFTLLCDNTLKFVFNSVPQNH
jgi:hypothetical protein